MIDEIKPFLARAVAILVAWLAGHFAIKFGVTISTEAQAQLANEIVNIVVILLGVYAASHRILSKWSNPGDAASTNIAVAETTEAARLKRIG